MKVCLLLQCAFKIEARLEKNERSVFRNWNCEFTFLMVLIAFVDLGNYGWKWMKSVCNPFSIFYFKLLKLFTAFIVARTANLWRNCEFVVLNSGFTLTIEHWQQIWTMPARGAGWLPFYCDVQRTCRESWSDVTCFHYRLFPFLPLTNFHVLEVNVKVVH